MARKTIRRKRTTTRVARKAVRKTARKSATKSARKSGTPSARRARAKKGPGPSRVVSPGRAVIVSATARTMATRAQPMALTGFVVLPQVTGNGYYFYSPADRQFGTPATVQAVVDVGRQWLMNPVTAGTPFGAGDISVEGGGPMSPHTSGHQKGRNIDLRPMRKDGKHLPVTFQSADYSLELTQLLVDNLLAHANTSFILFNDSNITGVRPLAGHDNHLHVQLKS